MSAETGETETTVISRTRGYHHGHLAEALLDAGVELARIGGPDAVVLRGAARRVGVSATAAYRHFDGQTALVTAVKLRALEELATQMQAAGRKVPASDPVARLEAIGRAYLNFALTESGLFRTFCIGLPMMEDIELTTDVRAFGLLTEILQEMESAGLLDPTMAAGAPVSAWAAVHGLAILCLDGPLSHLPEPELELIFQTTLRMVLGGLSGRR
ncbi:DNA-binding transcriptional regulator, AcrR family [Nakamurella panacisegetis]|uniref:DNA-binding transcriptional regulator, AcrR family n=1 Tax=Nakamurella panacisegetis TaxID=1090615 RepID=A0A1H0M9F1_9ACTN|nr:TetR/AcrR family transcriptional regulator [Nakamurella panacisegetis]SDO77053.1 DNA-binding transcriptional regulator, AcrR family [Nakamurella panacisegetis]